MVASDSGPSPTALGLQAERTDLAWSRTALSCAVNGALFALQHHLHGPPALEAVAIGLAALLWLMTWLMSTRRRRVLEARPLPEPLAAPVTIGLLSLGTGLLGVLTLVLVWIE